jgi:30S ribosomal protein S17
MPKRILTGRVISTKSNKTVVVEITRRVKHRLYKKIIKKAKKYHAHDEKDVLKVGDLVSIQETKPISKLKSWIVLNNSTSEAK